MSSASAVAPKSAAAEACDAFIQDDCDENNPILLSLVPVMKGLCTFRLKLCAGNNYIDIEEGIQYNHFEESTCTVQVNLGRRTIGFGKPCTDNRLSRSLCCVGMTREANNSNNFRAWIKMEKDDGDHSVHLDGQLITTPKGEEIQVNDGSIIALFGPDTFKYEIRIQSNGVVHRGEEDASKIRGHDTAMKHDSNDSSGDYKKLDATLIQRLTATEDRFKATQLEITAIGNENKFKNGDDVNVSKSRKTENWVAHDLFAVCNKIDGVTSLKIASAPLNGKYTTLFHAFPCLTQLRVSCVSTNRFEFKLELKCLQSLKCLEVLELEGGASKYISGNLEDFFAHEQLTELQVRNCPNIEGNFNDLHALRNLERLILDGVNVTGSILDIKDDHFPNLVHSDLPKTVVGGNFYELKNTDEGARLVDCLQRLQLRDSPMQLDLNCLGWHLPFPFETEELEKLSPKPELIDFFCLCGCGNRCRHWTPPIPVQIYFVQDDDEKIIGWGWHGDGSSRSVVYRIVEGGDDMKPIFANCTFSSNKFICGVNWLVDNDGERWREIVPKASLYKDYTECPPNKEDYLKLIEVVKNEDSEIEKQDEGKGLGNGNGMRKKRKMNNA